MLLKLIPDNTKITFMKLRIPALIMSAILLIGSIALVFTRSLNFGIDFAGGTVIEISEPADVNVEQIRSVLGGLNLGEVQVTEASGTGLNAERVVVIRIGKQGGDGMDAEQAGSEVSKKVLTALSAAIPSFNMDEDLRRSETVGPKVSGELLQDGLWALFWALLLMMVYITFRFEWHYGVGAVAALFHDVIITIGMFSLLQFEFNLTTIAALLTIIGYSMNDTVVVFDRVREERRRYKKLPLVRVIDIALNGTLSRTILTSGTTLLALLAIFFFGGEVLRGMSSALIWGILIGTYSSIFVASALLIYTGLDKHRDEDEAGNAAADPADDGEVAAGPAGN